MAHQQFAGVAVLVVLTFMVLALAACANTEQTVAQYGPSIIAPIPAETPGQPEFHGAAIGSDTLRSRLLAE